MLEENNYYECIFINVNCINNLINFLKNYELWIGIIWTRCINILVRNRSINFNILVHSVCSESNFCTKWIIIINLFLELRLGTSFSKPNKYNFIDIIIFQIYYVSIYFQFFSSIITKPIYKLYKYNFTIVTYGG